MSLINDALKQARKGPPEKTPGQLKPLQPVGGEPRSLPAWLLPVLVVVILLVVAAVFFIGWAVTHHGNQSDATQAAASAPAPVAVAPTPSSPTNTPAASPLPPVPAVSAPSIQVPATVPPPVSQPPGTNPAPAPEPPPFVPKLQGIDYNRTAPSAILNGKTVHPGDIFHQYRIKAISNNSVTLIGPDNKESVVEMGN